MTADEALDLLGETSDGFGPEADQAWDIVRAELDRLRAIEGAAHQTLHLAGYDREPVVMAPTDVMVLRGLALDHLAKAGGKSFGQHGRRVTART